jgi:glycosyltransferase involved in cell wall biosynthesis
MTSSREIPTVTRDTELVFLGRLVSDKGARLILEAMSRLKDNSLFPHLTVIGKGPRRTTLA